MARIVVAGSGSVGACIAYHLALLGARDVVLAERGRIASGSTFHDERAVGRAVWLIDAASYALLAGA